MNKRVLGKVVVATGAVDSLARAEGETQGDAATPPPPSPEEETRNRSAATSQEAGYIQRQRKKIRTTREGAGT